jgi:hypothetical protein
MNSEVSFESIEQTKERISDNKTNIEVIKTKVEHLEKWAFLFITEFHIGIVVWLIFKITDIG